MGDYHDFRNTFVLAAGGRLPDDRAHRCLGGDDTGKVQGKDAVKGASQVAIAAFNVGFIFRSTDQTKASGGLMGAFGGATKAKSSLVGVTRK
jgi:hypothetical protein